MSVLDGCDGFRLRDGRALSAYLISDEPEPDLARVLSADYECRVWFRPSLATASTAVVEIVDRANLIPLDDCEVDAVDAVDRFNHPSVWSDALASRLLEVDAS